MWSVKSNENTFVLETVKVEFERFKRLVPTSFLWWGSDVKVIPIEEHGNRNI